MMSTRSEAASQKKVSRRCSRCGSAYFSRYRYRPHQIIACPKCKEILRYLRNGNARAFTVLEKQGREIMEIYKKLYGPSPVFCNLLRPCVDMRHDRRYRRLIRPE